MIYKYFKAFVSIITGLTITAAAFVGFNSYVATAKDLRALEENTLATFKSMQLQIQQSGEQQRLLSLTQRYYQLKDLLRKYPADADLREEYLEVKEELKILKQKLSKEEDK